MANPATPPQEKERVSITSMADFEALKQKVETKQKSTPAEKRREEEQRTREEIALIAAADYEEQEIDLPPGWSLVPWTQKMLMDIYEEDALRKSINGEYDNQFRRNYETTLSVLKHGGFGATAVTEEMIGNMHWQDVRQIFLAIIAHYENTIFIKKK